VVARVLLWSLSDSMTNLDEVREKLPPVPEGDLWIANEASERFGLISFADDPPDLRSVRDLIGRDPDAFEEFDVW
jgi:hypothetical protein